MRADSSGNGHNAKCNSPLDTPRWHFGGFYGFINASQGKLQNGWTDGHQSWYTFVDSSGNGHRLKTIRHTIPQGGIGGGGGRVSGSRNQKTGKTAGPMGLNFAHNFIMQMNVGMDTV